MTKIRTLFLAGTMAAVFAAGCDDDDTTPSKPVDASLPPDAAPGDAKLDTGGTEGGAGETGGETGGNPDTGVDTTGSETGMEAGTDVTTDGAANPYQPKLLINLPVTCNTPDGMRIHAGTGNVILSCPNFFAITTPGTPTTPPVFAAPAVLMKITPSNTVEPWFSNLPLPGHTGAIPDRPGPMGIDFGPDGHLYVADHQYRYDTNYKSRIVRVNVNAGGNATTADVVVEGLRLANAVMWSRDFLYVSDTWAFEGADMGKSAIYRFTKAELAAATTASPIRIMKPTSTTMVDPHMFHQFATEAGRGLNLAGADGITFDAQGTLYTGKFGDGIMTKIPIDASGVKGTVEENWVKDPKMTCVDGIFFHAASNKIYVADSQKNAIQVVDVASKAVTTLWENENTNGDMGMLDQPAEPLIRGMDLLIANFDAGFPMTQPGKNAMHDAPYTLSVIKLP
jgi:DNA-binding beta-propeller fold protein YncE